MAEPRKPARKPAKKSAPKPPEETAGSTGGGSGGSAEEAEAAAAVATTTAAAAVTGDAPAPARRRRATQAVRAAAESVEEAREAEEEADEATDAAQRAAEAALAAAAEAGVEEDDPLLDTAIRQIEAGVSEEQPFGEPGDPIAERSPFRIAFVAALGVLTALLLAQAVVLVRDVIVLIVVAAFLAIGLNPAVEFLQRRGLKRGAAVGAIIGAVLLFFAGFVAAAAPPVVNQASQLQETVPEYAERLRNNATFRKYDDQYQITEKVRESAKQNADEAAGSALTVAKTALTFLVKTLTVLILTLYFLSAYPRIKRGAYRLIPRSRRARGGLIADEILNRVGGYVLGNLATSVVAGVVAAIFLMIMGVPSPIALAMLVAMLDLIPLVGATIAALVCTAVALFVSLPVGLITLAFFLAYQQVENYIVVPKVMKRTVDINPLATIVAALIGGTLLGVLGALLAIPVAAAIQLIGSEVVYPRQDAT